jgi:two-component system, chemotaxis family, response regulator Rcp1
MDDRPQARLILLLEPHPEHAQSIIAGFHGSASLRESTVPLEWVTIASYAPALDFIQQRGDCCDAARPDLILLNFSEPDNQAFVTAMKSNASLRRIPIIILNSALDRQQVLETYLSQGNCYVLKSFNLDELTAIAQRIEAFWLGIVTLPLE